MNKKQYMAYQTPALDLLEIVVEQGFEVSSGGTIEDAETDNWGDY
jgi:hypothetical protein